MTATPASPEVGGLRCPLCASPSTVEATRVRENGRRVVRRRRCSHPTCAYVYHSCEILAQRWVELTEGRTRSLFEGY